MGVKVRFWSGKWYVVIHYNRERTTLKMDTKAQAYALAEIMEKKLALEGLKAFREMQRGGKAQVPTVKEFSERWLAELGNSNLKPSTFKGYETNLGHPVNGEVGTWLAPSGSQICSPFACPYSRLQ